MDTSGSGEDVASGTDATVAFWEDLYGAKPQVWSGKVNAGLEREAVGLTPGRALDLGCGEGGDAVWLASAGWTVTAVDVSEVALARAAAHAAEVGLADRIDWQRHDLQASLPDGPFDLVSAQFLQSPIEFDRIDILRRAAATVAPGGALLSVSHAEFPPWSKHHHPDRHLPTPQEELDELGRRLDLEEWDVVRGEVVEREGKGPDGQRGTLYDGVLLLRRHVT